MLLYTDMDSYNLQTKTTRKHYQYFLYFYAKYIKKWKFDKILEHADTNFLWMYLKQKAHLAGPSDAQIYIRYASIHIQFIKFQTFGSSFANCMDQNYTCLCGEISYYLETTSLLAVYIFQMRGEER